MRTHTSRAQDISRFLARYDVSQERGFLGLADPLADIPEEFTARFAPWIELGEHLPDRLRLGTYKHAADQLPAFKGTLDGVPHAVLWRLSIVMGFLVQSYIWEHYPQAPRTELPAGLAVLFYKLCKKLGVDSSFNYMMYAGKNWKRIDPKLPITADNVTMLTHFNPSTSTERYRAEDWFVAIHVDIEARAGELLAAALRAEDARMAGDGTTLVHELRIIETTLYAMQATIERMNERCTPQVYYDHVRPYLSGFVRVPAGVLFHGVRALKGVPQHSLGQTGAQSSIAPLLDRFLCVTHDQSDPKARMLSAHLEGMLKKHTPPSHRKLVLHFEDVQRFANPEATWDAWEARHEEVRQTIIATRLALAEFRKSHFTLAVTHIVKPAIRVGDHTPIGTGGTDLSSSLPKHLEETLHPSHREEKMCEFREYFRSLLSKAH